MITFFKKPNVIITFLFLLFLMLGYPLIVWEQGQNFPPNGGSTPGGSTNDIQYNNNGALGGITGTISGSVMIGVNGSHPIFSVTGTPGEIVNSTPYTVQCDSATTTMDRGTTIEFVSGASSVVLPDPATSGCGNNFPVRLISETSITLTSAKQVTVNNGSSTVTFCNSGCTNTSLAMTAGEWVAVNSPDNLVWQADEVVSASSSGVPNPSANGIVACTGTNCSTSSARTITGTANQIAVTNGDGVSGNPTLSFPSTIVVPNGSTATTQSANDNSTKVATTAYVDGKARIWSCRAGLGDGLNAIPAGTYPQTTCYNDTGVTVTITGVKCYADGGTPTMNVSGHTLGALLTGAITCTTAYAAGTQSANVSLTSGDYLQFSFVAGGTAKQTDWVVTGTY
ncbi:hypothetical protein KGP36_03240 [Patescibacteria group bacterium]|nr:hypothetical protein [Patescibacteria group bacterium]